MKMAARNFPRMSSTKVAAVAYTTRAARRNEAITIIIENVFSCHFPFNTFFSVPVVRWFFGGGSGYG